MMKRIFIFAAILLATLSMVNAIPHRLHKRATTFAPCPPEAGTPPTAVTVTINPDPPTAGGQETFTFSGTPAVDIPAGSMAAATFVDSTSSAPIGTLGTGDFCSMPGITCPVTAGTPFSDVSVQATAPATLPDSYMLIVTVVDPASNTTAFCAAALVGAPSAPTSDPTAPPADPSAPTDPNAPPADPSAPTDPNAPPADPSAPTDPNAPPTDPNAPPA